MAVVAVGTDKGAWVLEDDGAGGWTAGDPLFPGWRVTAFGRAPDGTYLAGTASGWFGPAVHRSADLREWTQVDDGPRFEPAPADAGHADPEVQQVWAFEVDGEGRLWCGVAEAGLFTSDDGGLTWAGVEGFNAHPTRAAWVPGAGGMCAHRIIHAGERTWAAASAIGVFRSDDAGATWQPRNEGVGTAAPDEAHPEVGSCVHGLVVDPDDPDRLWQQNHVGVFRSTDGAASWHRIEQGLPGPFGFPMVRDASTGALFTVPLTADVDRTPPAGAFAAYRSTDGGDSWHRAGTGWPDAPTYDAVLRGAFAADGEGRLVLGTTGGALYASADAGDTWQRLPLSTPRVNAVAFLDR